MRTRVPALLLVLALFAPGAFAQTPGTLPAPAPTGGDPFPPAPTPPPPTPPAPTPPSPSPPNTTPPADVPPLPPPLPSPTPSPPKPQLPKPARPPATVPPLPPAPPATVPPLPPSPPATVPALPTAADLGVPPPPPSPTAPMPAAPPPIGPTPTMPAAPPPIVGGADPCAPPPGFKGKFTPPPGCKPAPRPLPKAPPTLSHSGQFIVQGGLIELPYLFNRVTERSEGDTRVGWLPTLGLGWASGQDETILKFGVGVNRYAADTAFAFGLERRHYFGTGTVKAIFGWNTMLSAGGAVTISQLFGLTLGLQIDPTRRYGFYLMISPGVLWALGGSSPGGTSNNDAAFVLTTHAGVQLRF